MSRKFLQRQPAMYDDVLNRDLMTKKADDPLVEYVIDSWKSLEVAEAFKCTGFEYSEKESEIDINKHIFKREKKTKRKERYDYKFINDDRYGKLTVSMDITLKEEDKETGKFFMHTYPMKKTMLIPLQDEEGFYHIKGKKYYLIYQLVEKSTYTSNSSVTLKSLMPIAVKRNVVGVQEAVIEDVNGDGFNVPCYNVFVFRREIPIILFYLSKGTKYTLDYLEVSNFISFQPTLPPDSENDEEYIYFAMSNKCYMKVYRKAFEDHQYIQSIVGAFATVCTNRTTMDQLEDTDVWIKKIANPNNLEKGKDTLRSFNRLLDKVVLSK